MHVTDLGQQSLRARREPAEAAQDRDGADLPGAPAMSTAVFGLELEPCDRAAYEPAGQVLVERGGGRFHRRNMPRVAGNG